MKALHVVTLLALWISGASSIDGWWQADMMVTQPLDSDCHPDLRRIFRRIAKLILTKVDPNAIIFANGEIKGVNLPDIGLGRNPCKIAGYCQMYPNVCLLIGCPQGGGRRLQLLNSTQTIANQTNSTIEGLPSEKVISRAGTRRIRRINNTFPACKIDQLEFIFTYV